MIWKSTAGIGIAAILAALGHAGAAGQAAPSIDHPVLELRQYKLVSGKTAAFVSLFEAKFVESHEAVGIRLIGQFRDHDRPDRFTWLREFSSMTAREKALNDFYFGPVWKANRGVANPMLDDNDNVLLLRPARPGAGFAPTAPRPKPGAAHGVVIVMIEYLWKDPNQAFSGFFLDRVAPALRSAGLPVLGSYVAEEQPNNFARLPVRQGEKVLVWFTRAESLQSYDLMMKRLQRTTAWRTDIAPGLKDFRERDPQVLRLDPTPRSALR